MTRYTVVWHQDALDQLTNIWIKATDRNAISLAANMVDQHLATEAESKGVPLEAGLRLLALPPIRVLFAVSDPDRLVKVLHIEALG